MVKGISMLAGHVRGMENVNSLSKWTTDQFDPGLSWKDRTPSALSSGQNSEPAEPGLFPKVTQDIFVQKRGSNTCRYQQHRCQNERCRTDFLC